MNPRKAFFACLERSPPALFEAALRIAAEHDPAVQPLAILQALTTLAQQVSMGMPMLPADELGQPLLRRLNDLGFAQDDFTPLRPAAALLDKVLQRQRGQPLAMGLIAMGGARRLDIPMVGVNFPGISFCACPVPTTCWTLRRSAPVPQGLPRTAATPIRPQSQVAGRTPAHRHATGDPATAVAQPAPVAPLQ